MLDFSILTVLIFLPLLGTIFLLCIRSNDPQALKRNAKNTALFVSIATWLLSLVLWYGFDPNVTGYQFETKFEWITGYNIYYHVGIDGLSLFLIQLTTLLTPLCILASWKSIKHRVREFMIAFLLLETMIIGVFSALDLVLFYLFFEAVLIPMYFIIGIWGSDNRVYAAFKFFLYTLAGSVLLLIAVLYIYHTTGTTDIPELLGHTPYFAKHIQQWLWLAFLASFAIKVPMWPVHTWLPDAHVQAPTAGSVILAGILLKLGGYGLLRLSLPLLPEASVSFAPLIFTLSIIAIIYTSLVALMQKDMKKLIAYSSIAHMGFVTIGIFSFNQEGIDGSILVMISHGIISGALFLCVGVLYDRMHTKAIAEFGGVVKPMPIFAAVFMLFTLGAVALPGTSGFVGELVVLVGAFKANMLVAALAATGVVLGAAYMLWLYRRVVFGTPKSRDIERLPELTTRELIVFAPLLLLVLAIGIYPAFITDYTATATQQLLHQLQPLISTP